MLKEKTRKVKTKEQPEARKFGVTEFKVEEGVLKVVGAASDLGKCP